MVTPRFLLVMGATLAYYVCVGLLIPVLPVFIENGMNSGEAMIGATAVAFSITAVAARPFITWVGNRFGRRSMMLWGSVLSAVAGVLHVAVTEPWQLLPLRALMGIGEAGLFVGASTVVVELSPDTRRAEAASYLSLSVFGGLAVGPIIGEPVMGRVAETARGLGVGRFDAVFWLMTAFAGVAALVSLATPRWVGERPVVDKHHVSWMQREAVLPGMILAGGIVSWTAFSSFVPGYAKQLGLAGSAAFFTLYSILCLVIRLIGARWPERFGLKRMVMFALVCLTFGTGVVAIMASEAGIWIGTVLMGFGMSFLYPSLLAMSVQRIEAVKRVAVVASFTAFFEIGSAVGGLALGAVGQLFGKRSTFVGGSVFAASAFVLLLWSRQRSVTRTAVGLQS